MTNNYKQLVEIVGVLAVVASLIFVGVQLLLDRRIAESEVYFQRAESLKSDYRSQMESEAFLEAQVTLWEQGDRPFFWTPELEAHINKLGLNHRETITLILSIQTIALHYDTQYFQYNKGLLDESSWQGFKRTFAGRLQDDTLERAVFMSYPRGLRAVLDEILVE